MEWIDYLQRVKYTSFSMVISDSTFRTFCALDNVVTFALLTLVKLEGASLTKNVLNPRGGILGWSSVIN